MRGPVICDNCGREVERQARQQRFCSARCKEAARGRRRSRKALLTRDAGAPSHPLKKLNGFSALEGPESRSSLVRTAIETEFFGGRTWRPAVSSGGVEVEVARIRPRALMR
jgi:hypothetical protein